MKLDNLFESFKKKKIIVIGDVMIDTYLNGKVTRVSPEAPVPIVNFSSREERLGGAANVALNLRSFESNVEMLTVIGDDDDGLTILELFKNEKIGVNGVIQSNKRKTTVKTRVIGNNQQLLRVDQEQTDDIQPEDEKRLLDQLEKLLIEGCDSIIFQDYNKGVLTKKVIHNAIQLAKKYNVLTTTDPKHKNFFAYKGVSLFKPNLKELSDGVQKKIDLDAGTTSFIEATEFIKEKLKPEVLFITLSEKGVYIDNRKSNYFLPAFERKIADVSGAGDSVISVATLCLCSAVDVKTLALMANLAGGIVCEYRGVVAIQAQQLYDEAKKIGI